MWLSIKGFKSQMLIIDKENLLSVRPKDPFILALLCGAVPIIIFCYNSTQLIAFKVKMNLTLLRHNSAVTPQSLCSAPRQG